MDPSRQSSRDGASVPHGKLWLYPRIALATLRVLLKRQLNGCLDESIRSSHTKYKEKSNPSSRQTMQRLISSVLRTLNAIVMMIIPSHHLAECRPWLG